MICTHTLPLRYCGISIDVVFTKESCHMCLQRQLDEALEALRQRRIDAVCGQCGYRMGDPTDDSYLLDESVTCRSTGRQRFQSPTCEHCGRVICGSTSDDSDLARGD